MTEAVAVRCCAKCGAVYRNAYACCPSDGGELQLHDRDPLLGSTLGPYEIEELIGEGGMSRVYRARHSRLQQRKLAVKVLLGDFAANLEMRLRFAHEAELASTLNHPNIVSVLDYGVTDRGMTYLAMEYIEGGALSGLIDAEAPLPLARVLALGRGMCRGLAHAHDAGIIHRDFKPDNVLVVTTADGEVVRIADFGLAITSNEEVSARYTQTGIALGTPLYAAPEQTHGDPDVDSRADLFGLGVTLYEMTAGMLPYDSDGAMDAMRVNATGKPPPIAERTAGRVRVPAAFDDLLRRMLSRKPSDRPNTALEVLVALDAIDVAAVPAEAAALPAEAAAVSLAAAPPQRGKLWRWAALGALLAVGATVLLVTQSSGQRAAPQVRPATIAAAQLEQESRAPVTPVIVTTPPPDAALARAEPPSPTPPARRTSTPPPRSASRRPREKVETAVVAEVRPPESAPALAPVRPSAPAPVPTPAPTPDVKLEPPPRNARVTVEKLDVRGALSASVLQRGIERVLPAVQRCYIDVAAQTRQRGSVRVRVALKIDDTRRAVDVQSASPWTALSTCTKTALGGIRTSTAPDVGIVGVQFELSIVGVP